MPRNRAWVDSVFSSRQVVDEGNNLTNLLVDASTVDTLTAVRIVVDLTCLHDVAMAADATNFVHVGIGVCSTEAFAQGVNSLPEPQFQDQYPPRGWLYVASKPVTQAVITATGFTRTHAHFSADLRSMRKIDKGILFLLVQNTGVLGAQDIDLWGRVRVLCLT